MAAQALFSPEISVRALIDPQAWMVRITTDFLAAGLAAPSSVR